MMLLDEKSAQTTKRYYFFDGFTPELAKALREVYALGDLRGDAAAGVTVAVVGIPLAMGLAVASGAPPGTGVVSAIIGGFLISALGGSRFQIGGPASAFVALIAKIVESHGVQGLFAATIMAGAILLFLGYMRYGHYIKYIPHSVPVGFTAGVAVILFVSQIKDFLGLQIEHEPAALARKVLAMWDAFGTLRIPTLLVGGASLALLLYLRLRKPRLPCMILTLIVAAAFVWLFNLPVDTIGSRYGDLPHPLLHASWPAVDVATVFELVPAAIAIAALVAIESLMSAVVADGMTDGRHNSNAELVAQGYANIASGLFGGLCCAGALTRTATNVRSGACGPMAGVFASVVLFGIMEVASPLASHVPLATLAAVIGVIAWDMLDRAAIMSIFKRDRQESLVLVVTFLMTTFRDVTEGIAVGVSFGSLLFMYRMAEFVEAQAIEPESAPTTGALSRYNRPSSEARSEETGVYVYRIQGPLFFGVASTIFDALQSIQPAPSAFVVDFGRVPIMDGSAAESFLHFSRKSRGEGRRVIIAAANSSVKKTLMANREEKDLLEFEADVDAAARLVQ